MVLGEFLSDTRRRWKKALKLFKRSQQRKSLTSPRHNRVSPTPTRGGSRLGGGGGGGGTVDASGEIALERFCRCSATPPFPHDSPHSTYENLSYADSAYDTDRASPCSQRAATHLSYATVTYFLDSGGKDKEDSCSVATQLTWLEVELAEAAGAAGAAEAGQNVVNEKIELLTSL